MREAESRRLRAYIDQLLAEVLKQSDSVSVAIMTGMKKETFFMCLSPAFT